jgi:predicted membrane chloride channel (bestrophin family)
MKRFGQFKKARRVSFLRPLSELIIRPSFSPAEFQKNSQNQRYIVSYDPSSLFSYGFINPKGSTLSWGVVFRTVLMCGAGTLVSQFNCNPGDDYTFCFPIMVSAEGLIFASLVSFLLGLFASTTFTRWWSTREKLGSIMNNITALNILLSNFAPTDDESQASVKTITRWMNLAHSLVYKQANNDTDFSDLLDSGLANKAEVERFIECKNLSLPPIVYGWVTRTLHPMFSKMSPVAAISNCLAAVSGSLNAAQEVNALLKTQMPYAYLHLLAVATKIHLAFIVFYAGGIISQGITGHLWTRIVLGYTVIIANNIIYEGLLRIHAMLVNPLGDDDGDFPTHLYVADTIALGSALDAKPPVEANKIEVVISQE